MKHKVYFGIIWRIVALFGFAMLSTYLPEVLRDFFGDTLRDEPTRAIDVMWDWGSRHYWWFTGCIFIFLASTVNVIVGIVELITKEYPNLK